MKCCFTHTVFAACLPSSAPHICCLGGSSGVWAEMLLWVGDPSHCERRGETVGGDYSVYCCCNKGLLSSQPVSLSFRDCHSAPSPCLMWWESHKQVKVLFSHCNFFKWCSRMCQAFYSDLFRTLTVTYESPIAWGIFSQMQDQKTWQ